MSDSNLQIILTDPSKNESLACIDNYYSELQGMFDKGFDPELTVSAKPEELTPPKGYFFLAYHNGIAVGCGGLKIYPNYAEIKRMWVSSKVRGMGVGTALLKALEDQAKKINKTIIRLDTNKNLAAALVMYKKFGYQQIEPYNNNPYAHYWFEKTLTN